MIDGDGFHVGVEEGDLEMVAIDGDLAVQGLVLAEFEDTTAIGAELDTFVGESHCGDGSDEEGEDGFHGWGDVSRFGCWFGVT